MANIIDYIKWRGDLSFEENGFNIVDAAIFSQLTLIDFTGIVPADLTPITIEDAYEEYVKKGHNIDEPLGLVISNSVHHMFKAMANSKRFKSLSICHYKRRFNRNTPVQFQALYIEIDKQISLISYGGTDDSICGWQEDLAMIHSEIPSYKLAFNYFKQIVRQTAQKLYIVGHSKGGALAMYATLMSQRYQRRIISCYNFDGPGFNEQMFVDEKYRNHWQKITTILPSKSTIGRLLRNDSQQIIVKSDANLLYQHDLFSWQVIGKDFQVVKQFANESVYLAHKINGMVEALDYDNRLLLEQAIAHWFYSCGANNLINLQKNSIQIIPRLMSLKKEERAIINKVVIKGFFGDITIGKMIYNIIFKKDRFRFNDLPKKIKDADSR